MPGGGTRAHALLMIGWFAVSGLGCYTTREISPHDLPRREAPAVYRILYRSGERMRLVVDPENIAAGGIIEGRPCLYDARSWRIRFSGWPAVYSSGRYWRRRTTGETVYVSMDDIDRIWIERLDWPLTVLTAPISLPAGFIDFLVDHAQIGFDEVNDRFDTFSRPPAGS